MRRRGADVNRWTLLAGAIDSYRRAREALLENGGVERRVESVTLEARIVSATGVALHKSVRDGEDRERIRGEALRLSDEAEDLLNSVDRSAVGSMWSAFYAQIVARRGLSLALLGRHEARSSSMKRESRCSRRAAIFENSERITTWDFFTAIKPMRSPPPAIVRRCWVGASRRCMSRSNRARHRGCRCERNWLRSSVTLNSSSHR